MCAKVIALAVLMVLVRADAASAQMRSAHTRSPELDVGVIWTGDAPRGGQTATLTTPAGGTLPLFSIANEQGASRGVEVHVVVPITRRFHAEGISAWTRGELRTRISDDFEGVDSTVATVRLSQFTAEGAASWLFTRGRIEPFLRVGAGWMRQLTEDKVLAADGVVATAGGGVKYWWRDRDRGWMKRVGLRSDLRLAIQSDGVTFGTKRRVVAPSAGVSVMFGF